jgi:hypothetical protein
MSGQTGKWCTNCKKQLTMQINVGAKKMVNPVNGEEEEQIQVQTEEEANCDTFHSFFQSKTKSWLLQSTRRESTTNTIYSQGKNQRIQKN